MAAIQPFLPEKLIIGILVGPKQDPEPAVKRIESEFGAVDYRSPCIDFTFTDYYDREMGKGISRFFLSFADLVDPELLPDIKIKTNMIEESFSVEGRRTINLDPGIMDLNRLILATTKKSPHRIPLRKGIYGEITLAYRHKRFISFERTYPDFRTEQYHTILEVIRGLFKEQLKWR